MATKRVPVEIDITYTNKAWFSGHKRKDNTNHYVIGFFQREGKAIIVALENNDDETIKNVVFEKLSKGCMVYCEEGVLPHSLKNAYEITELKPEDGHANGDVHINNVKNMWRDLKRCIKREHHSVSKKHLQLYCSEVAWRINNRHLTPSEKFEALLGATAMTGKCTFQDLVKKNH